MSLVSNHRLIVEAYTKEALRGNDTRQTGFLMIDQKVKLKGLKLLVDASIVTPSGVVFYRKGSTVYFREEILHNAPWAQKPLTSEALPTPFILAEFNQVEMVDQNFDFGTANITIDDQEKLKKSRKVKES